MIRLAFPSRASIQFRLCILLLFVGVFSGRAESPLKLLREISVPQGCRELVVDETGTNLFVTGSNAVTIIDLKSNSIVSTFTDLGAIHAFTPLTELGFGLFLHDDKPELSLVWMETFRRVSFLKTGKNPIGILVVGPTTGYVLNRDEPNVTFFEPDDADFMGNLTLPGNPSAAIYEPQSQTIFFALQNKPQIVLMKTQKPGRFEIWDLPAEYVPTTLAYDPKVKGLLLNCRNKKLVLLNASTGDLMSQVAIAGESDRMTFDSSSQTAYVGSGRILNVVQAGHDGKLQTKEMKLPSDCRCLAVDPREHRLYVGTQNGILVYGK